MPCFVKVTMQRSTVWRMVALESFKKDVLALWFMSDC